jgi:hypothetical protein
MSNADPAVSEQDVLSMAEKLNTFLATLTPAEQTVLGVLLSRSLTLPEVQGHTAGLVPAPVLQALTYQFPTPTASVSYLGLLDSYRPR